MLLHLRLATVPSPWYLCSTVKYHVHRWQGCAEPVTRRHVLGVLADRMLIDERWTRLRERKRLTQSLTWMRNMSPGKLNSKLNLIWNPMCYDPMNRGPMLAAPEGHVRKRVGKHSTWADLEVIMLSEVSQRKWYCVTAESKKKWYTWNAS